MLQHPLAALDTEEQTIQAVDRAEQLYQQDRYPEAIALLKTAIEQYQSQGDAVGKAIATRNLALIYQKLGQWEQAESTLTQAEEIITTINSEPEKSQLLAQVLEVKGQVELSLGRSQSALETWQRATSLYQEQGNLTGLTLGKIYQANALQALGFYSQSLKTLTETNDRLKDEPDTLNKALALLNLGEVLNRVGKYQPARMTLKSAFTIAEKLADKPTMADVLLSLGNNAKLESKPETAIDFYQQAIAIAPQPDIQLRGKLNKLSVLINLEDRSTASNSVREIRQLLAQLPPNQTKIQGQISLARYLLELDAKPRQIADLLVNAIEQARKLDIPRTEADALGVLGNLYERNQELPAAAQITERASAIAQSVNA